MRGSPALRLVWRGPTPHRAFASLRQCLSGGAYALSHDAERPPVFRSDSFSAMPRSLTPPRSPAHLPYRAPTIAFQKPDAVGPRSKLVSRLNPFALTGCGLVVALSTLRRHPRGSPAQDSLRRGWLGLRRREFHPLESVGLSRRTRSASIKMACTMFQRYILSALSATTSKARPPPAASAHLS